MDERTNQVYSWYLNTVIILIMTTVHSGKPDYPGLEGSPVQSYEDCENYEIYENCEVYTMDERTNQVYSWYLNTVIMLIMTTVHSGKPDYPGLEGSPVQSYENFAKITKFTKSAKFMKNRKICNCVQSWTFTKTAKFTQ